MDSNGNLAVIKVVVDWISFNLIYNTPNLELWILSYGFLKWEDQNCLVMEFGFGTWNCDSWYDKILTYLWEELREAIFMEMIMDNSRWFMWNLGLIGVMKDLI